MSVETYQAEVRKWITTNKDGRWNKLHTDLTYLPMQQLLSYLRANGFKTYIVTGGGQDFVRVYSEDTFGEPRGSRRCDGHRERDFRPFCGVYGHRTQAAGV